MEIITNVTVYTDITTDTEKAQVFKMEFPELVDKIDKVLDKENPCPICKRELLSAIANAENMETRLKLIYGEDVQISLRALMDAKPRIVENKTFNIPIQDWEEWFNNFSKEGKNVINNFCFYNPLTDEVVVSMTYADRPIQSFGWRNNR